jgi:DNA-binding NtrC family response regulator
MDASMPNARIRRDYSRSRQSRKNFLVVDDDNAMRELMEQMVDYLGYHPILASDADQALQKLVNIRVDLVISDIQMPGSSGLDLLRRVKAQRPDLPVLLMSGCYNDSVKRKIQQYNADGFLPKPFSLDDLSRHIERLVK